MSVGLLGRHRLRLHDGARADALARPTAMYSLASAPSLAQCTWPPRGEHVVGELLEQLGQVGEITSALIAARRAAQPVGVLQRVERGRCGGRRSAPIGPGEGAAQPHVRRRLGGALAKRRADERVAGRPPCRHGVGAAFERGREHLGDVAGLDRAALVRGAGPQVHQARAVGARRPRRAAASASDASLSSAIVTETSGSFMLNRPPKPQHRSVGRPVDPGAARRRRRAARAAGRGRAARGAGGTSGGRRRGTASGELHRGQLAASASSSVSSFVRAPTARARSAAVVVADDLEQLGPEDADHRGARAGGHDDDVVAVGLERVERRARRPSPPRPRSPRSTPAARSTSGPPGTAPRTRPRAAPSRRQHADVGLEEVDDAGDEQRHAHGPTLSRYAGSGGRPTTPGFALDTERVERVRDECVLTDREDRVHQLLGAVALGEQPPTSRR